MSAVKAGRNELSRLAGGQFFMAVRMANKTAIMATAWRTEEALRPAQNLLNPHCISTVPKKHNHFVARFRLCNQVAHQIVVRKAFLHYLCRCNQKQKR